MSNRFTCLDIDSDSEEIQNLSVDEYPDEASTEPVVSLIVSDEDNSDSSKINQRNLVLASLEINSESSKCGIIEDSKKRLWSLMSGYINSVKLDSYKITYNKDFLTYVVPSSRSYFKRVVNHNEGDYQGTYISMWSWRVSPGKYIYICTIEGYGSCSYCDHVLFLESELSMLRWDIINIKSCRRIVDDHICTIYRNLYFFEKFSEAKKFILDRAHSYVKFEPLKTTSSTTVPRFDENNFPPLGK